MPSLRGPRRIFYGWVIVGNTFVSQMINHGLVFQGFGTFLLPLEQQFGWSKTALSGARSLMQIESGLLGPLEGALIDRLGPRAMLGAGMFLLGLGLVLLGQVQSLWSYYLAFAVMAIGSDLAGILVTSTVLNNWFRRKRTMAMALSQTGLGFGGLIVVPLLVLGQDSLGWRNAAVACGLFVWAAGVPLCLLMRSSPERYGLLPDGDPVPPQRERADVGAVHRAGVEWVDFTLKEALRTRAFWMLGLAHGISLMAVTAVATHQFAHMEMEQGVGLARATAALVVTVASVMNVFGRLAGGFLGDRFEKRYVAAAGTMITSLSLVILATASSVGMAMAFGVLFGLSWGMRGPMMNSIRGDYFGRTSFAKITGTAFILTTPGSIFGPIFAGIMADALGDYRLAFLLLAAISSLGALLFLLMRRPPAPVREAARATGPSLATRSTE